MKTVMTSRRTRSSSSPAANQRPVSANAAPPKSAEASTTAPSSPPPPPPKPLTVHQRFNEELLQILKGKVSGPGELYSPLSEFDPERHSRICVIADPVTRELFSLSQKLAQERKHLPLAKSASGMGKMKHDEAVFARQVHTIREIAYQRICAEHPQVADLDRSLEVLDGWIVATVVTPSDRLDSMFDDLSGAFGLPRELVEYLARDRAGE